MNFTKSLMQMGLFLFLALTSQASFAFTEFSPIVQQARQEDWAHRREWLRLLQYKKTLFQGYKSAAEPGMFFLSPQGPTNPQEELLANIFAFQDPEKKFKSNDKRFEEPAACLFPARKKWLEKVSGVKFPSPPCDRYERFKEILQPQSLTYVFSSYYLNNPASAFGHTFLRINKAPSAKDGERYELADYGVGYAAIKVSDNPLVYSFMGLSGLMPGAFDINPYYFKVREYNDFESRDIWEYDLNLTPDEVDTAIAYTWELIGANFNYHYMSENCAYRILTIFEVARPELEIVDRLKAQVLPADTVQTIFETAGLVTRIHYRPSIRATFKARYDSLSPHLQGRIRAFSNSESLEHLVEGLNPQDKRDALDAAMDYLDYRYPQQILSKTGKYDFKKIILADRAALGTVSPVLKIQEPWSEAPHDAQGSRRTGLGFREWNNQRAYLLDLKFALHDLLDPKLGYPPSAEITMGSFGVSYRPEANGQPAEAALDRALLYEVVSLSTLDGFNRAPSWRLKFSVDRGYENNCVSLCRWTELSGGSGITKAFFKDLELSLWARMTTLTSPDFTEETWRIGAGPAASVRWNRGSFALLAESYYRYDYKGADQEFRQNTLGVNWSVNKSFSARVQGEDTQSLQRAEAKLFWYY